MQPTARFSEALAYACHLHAAQQRKGSTIPYVAHLLAVTAIVLEHGGSEDEAIAAVLHDAIEDQGGVPVREEIRRRFGDQVAQIVEGCTDADTIPKPPWRARKQAYLTGLATAGPAVRLVSAADKLHNLRSLVVDYRRLGEALWDRFNGGKQGTLWYYRAVATELESSPCAQLVDELRQALAELERLVAAQSPE
ncbi:MAG TPA: HD domain-containing protein [Pirellulales bacterium]|jgi:(p)ppGpp synthase/HD superfamily hydrolase|nr:HD domain-containing protein [Pirellulales bacterium]